MTFGGGSRGQVEDLADGGLAGRGGGDRALLREAVGPRRCRRLREEATGRGHPVQVGAGVGMPTTVRRQVGR